MNSVSRALIKADNFLDYVPVLSSISNLVILFQKCVLANVPKNEITDHYYKHIKDKSCVRCVILLIPVIGNVIIAINDLINKKNINNPSSNPNHGNGLALEHAGDTVKDDYNVFFRAVQHNPLALQHASARLRNHSGIVAEAVKVA